MVRALVSTSAALLLAGCVGLGGAPGFSNLPVKTMLANHRPASTNQYVFVTNDLGLFGAAEIDYWPVGSTGNVAPSGVIAGASTHLVYGLQGIVVNAAGEIYVASGSTNAILGFAPNSNGNVAPNVVIKGSATGLDGPVGLALDRAGNLFVANCGTKCTQARGGPSIEEFSAESNGNVAPARRIRGRRTLLDAPFGMAIGGDGRIYVVDTDYYSGSAAEILIFGRHARRDEAPKRVITGSGTKLKVALGLAVDANGIYTDSWANDYIERFSLRANGDVPPRAVIDGRETQLTCCLDGIITAPDSSVYVVDRGTPSIIQFDGRARGDAAPLTNLHGANTRLSIPLFVYVAAQPT